MKTIPIHTFGEGMVNDLHSGSAGNFSLAKNYDVLTYPNRLFPLPSMQASTAGTGVGNMITALNGTVYGIGIDSGSAGQGSIWKTTGTSWTELTNGKSGITVDYSLLVEYPENHATRTILYSTSTGIIAFDPADAVGIGTNHALTHTSMTQGYVHPKDNIMYLGYTTSTATYIALNNAGAWNDTALQLPKKYTPTSISSYGNYLAIACTQYSSGVIPGSSVDTSVVFLWDRDTSLATVTEIIRWGDNTLQVLNGLDGVLIGVSKNSSSVSSGFSVKIYSDSEPVTVKTILATTTNASITINPRVNIIHRGRLYFSVDIPGSSDSPIYKGLWSIGKNAQGRYTVNLERIPTVDGSIASVIAATFRLDALHTVHTVEGTITTQFAGSTPTTDYGVASVYESIINPNMTDLDYIQDKQLDAVYATYYPLTSGQQVVMKYRVDSALNGAWTTIFTETTTGQTKTEMVIAASGDQFTSGENYEFRIESTGRAQITSFGYKYHILSSNT